MSIASITICSLSHKDVWELTAPLMLKNLEIDNFFVYVPKDEVEAFSNITPSEFQILSQDKLDSKFAADLRRRLENLDNADRYGWYAQQFMKLEAVRQASSNQVVIWDADCVPVRPVPLFSKAGLPLYMKANEGHEPYFEVIDSLFGSLNRSQGSFVIPGFPFFQIWFEEMIAELEGNSGLGWESVLMQKSQLGSLSGFSETETLGTWAFNRHREDMSWVKLNWERRGTSRFGYASKFSIPDVEKIGHQHDLDIISFENWDLRGLRLFKFRLANKVRGLLGAPAIQPKAI